jgi:fumarate reductase subunit C
MARNAHPHAMAPSKPGSTRTAPPQLPDKFPMEGRYTAYTLFDWTGFLYLILGFLALGAVQALGAGAAAWNHVMLTYQGGVYICFHLLALVGVIFVGVRFFGFFPKSQPPRIGPVKSPPQPVIFAILYAAWIGVAGGMAIILAGGIF